MSFSVFIETEMTPWHLFSLHLYYLRSKPDSTFSLFISATIFPSAFAFPSQVKALFFFLNYHFIATLHWHMNSSASNPGPCSMCNLPPTPLLSVRWAKWFFQVRLECTWNTPPHGLAASTPEDVFEVHTHGLLFSLEWDTWHARRSMSSLYPGGM